MTSDLNMVVGTSGDIHDEQTIEYVTVYIGKQLFGMPIFKVHDVFMPENMTKVPLSDPQIAGVLNLRGRIVTAIDMRRRLELPLTDVQSNRLAVGIEYKGESFGLIVDDLGEVMRLPKAGLESNPSNLDPRWTMISQGIYRLDGQLLVVFDVDRILDGINVEIAA